MEAPTPHSHDLLLTGELRELPAYTVPEAARYLGLPPATVRAWTYGTTTGKPGKKRRFDPVIQPPAGEGRRLSYFNLAEVFVLRESYGAGLSRSSVSLAHREE